MCPRANRSQDALRDEIKGRVTQTYLNPEQQVDHGRRIRGSTTTSISIRGEKSMAGVNVFELDPNTFRLRRQIQAQRAQWRPSLKTWIFENGWSSDFHGVIRRCRATTSRPPPSPS